MKIALSIAAMHLSGVSTFVLNLSQALMKAGHEVLVIAPQHGIWWPRLAEAGVQSFSLPRLRWNSMRRVAHQFADFVAAQRADVLVVNIGSSNRQSMLALHLLPDDLPVGVVLHGDQQECYDMAAVNEGMWNCAVGVSPKVQQMAAARFAEKSVEWIPCGIALPSRDVLRSRADHAHPLRMLFVGRLDDHQKGIFRLPAILAECRRQQMPVRLTVIGGGPDEFQLRQQFQEAGVADLVEMRGFLSNEAACAAMRSHHLLLLPSNFEGLGLVLLESQANGCVPIAANLKNVVDSVITDRVDGRLVEPTDISAYASAIHGFLDAAEWRRCSRAGIDHTQLHFSVERMVERYLALFSALQQGSYSLPAARSILRARTTAPFMWRDDVPQTLQILLAKAARWRKYLQRKIQN